jgi:hypothetical protein
MSFLRSEEKNAAIFEEIEVAINNPNEVDRATKEIIKKYFFPNSSSLQLEDVPLESQTEIEAHVSNNSSTNNSNSNNCNGSSSISNSSICSSSNSSSSSNSNNCSSNSNSNGSISNSSNSNNCSSNSNGSICSSGNNNNNNNNNKKLMYIYKTKTNASSTPLLLTGIRKTLSSGDYFK